MNYSIPDKKLKMKPAVKLQRLSIRKSPYPVSKKARHSPDKKLKIKPVIALERLNPNQLLSVDGDERKKS